MSTLYNTTTLVARLKQRIPMGLADPFCMDKLNEAYQWSEQQGAFMWNVKIGGLVVPQGSSQVYSLGLTDLDPGKPISLYPKLPLLTPSQGMATEIPWVPMDEIGLHEIYHRNSGQFSVWTLLSPSGGVYGFQFAPGAAAPGIGGQEFVVYYHIINPALVTPLVLGASFFPTPNAYDILLIDLAEAEIKRIYGLTGWADAIQKAQASATLELDKYRSPRRDLAGISEQTKEVQEKSLNQAQAGG